MDNQPAVGAKFSNLIIDKNSIILKSTEALLSRLILNNDKIKEFLKLNRCKTRMALQILSEHAALNYHLHKMKCTSSPDCPKCGDGKETVEHFIEDCPFYAQKRGEV